MHLINMKILDFTLTWFGLGLGLNNSLNIPSPASDTCAHFCSTWKYEKKKSKVGCFSKIAEITTLAAQTIQKAEKILEDSLDSTLSPSPSVKIQIIGGKVYLR